MAWHHRIFNTLRSNNLQRELDEELRLHLDLRIADLQRQGLSAEDARYEATKDFGNFSLQTEKTRTMDINAWMESLIKDVRYSLRQFARTPVFTAVAVASLAIGIGANTAIFSVMNTALLKALPVQNPQELVMLTNPNRSGVSIGMSGGERSLLTYPEYLTLRSQNTTLAGLMAVESEMDSQQVHVAGNAPEDAHLRLVTEGYFSLLGVDPAIGRVFNDSDAMAVGGDPYAVISYDYWQKRFGGKTNVLGTPIRINKTAFTVIGVAPAGFHGESVGDKPDMWLPMLMQPLVMPGREWLEDPHAEGFQKVMWLHAIGRLKPGMTVARTQTEMDVLFRAIIESSYPPSMSPEARKRALDQKIKVFAASTGRSADAMPSNSNCWSCWVRPAWCC